MHIVDEVISEKPNIIRHSVIEKDEHSLVTLRQSIYINGEKVAGSPSVTITKDVLIAIQNTI